MTCDFCLKHSKDFNIPVEQIFCPRCQAAEQANIVRPFSPANENKILTKSKKHGIINYNQKGGKNNEQNFNG
jgi:hypothetical protein